MAFRTFMETFAYLYTLLWVDLLIIKLLYLCRPMYVEQLLYVYIFLLSMWIDKIVIMMMNIKQIGCEVHTTKMRLIHFSTHRLLS